MFRKNMTLDWNEGQPIVVDRVILDLNDGDDEIVIGVAMDGRWFYADASCGSVRTAPTAEALCQMIWGNGKPGPLDICALYGAGWLAPNFELLRQLSAGKEVPTRIVRGWILSEAQEVKG
jgi:hypothetical protein